MAGTAYWVYMVECDNGSYYTGSTDNVVRRYWQHCHGLSRAKYTRSFRPVRMACCWKVMGARGDALKVEKFIKKRDRSFKEGIIADPEFMVRLAALEFGLQTVFFEGAMVENLAHIYTGADSRRGLDPMAPADEIAEEAKR